MNITNNTQSYNFQAEYPKPEVPVNLEDVKEKLQEVQKEEKLQETKQKDSIIDYQVGERLNTSLLEYQRVQEQVLRKKGIEEYQKNILL